MNRTPRTLRPHTSIVGSKFEATRHLAAAQVAKLVRADIKAAVAAGKLPKARYSVCTSGSSTHEGITVAISNVREPGFALFNPRRLAWGLANPHASLCDAPLDVFAIYSDRAHALIVQIEQLVGEYNRSIKSNEPDDYSNEHFHVSADFGGEWHREMREIEIDIAQEAHALTKLAASTPANDTSVSAQESFLASIGAL